MQVLDEVGVMQAERALSEISEIVIEGTDADDTLTLDFGAGDIDVPILFNAGDGEDTLRGPLTDSTWNINGPNSGDVEGVEFTDVENLTGAPDNEDTFVFEDGGSLSGSVDGGDGGYDSLDIQFSNIQSLVYEATGPDSGVINADGNIIDFVG